MPESYDYFEHGADIGIVGRGASVEQAMERAAMAVFALMTRLDTVQLRQSVALQFEEADRELALLTWLNLLLGEARSRGLVFRKFELRRDGAPPEGTSSGARWSGTAQGEPWRDGLERGVEVKGATLTGLALRQTDGLWEARCVVDV